MDAGKKMDMGKRIDAEEGMDTGKRMDAEERMDVESRMDEGNRRRDGESGMEAEQENRRRGTGAGGSDTVAGEAEMEEIRKQARAVLTELLQAADMKEGQILVVGCSSSEIGAHQIGSFSSAEIGKAVFEEIYEELNRRKIFLAAQCCEHLNRALIVEEACALQYGLEMVNVAPQLKAGGSFATAAYGGFHLPVAVERIQAHGGIDIGDTLIGMHLRPVAVPVRTSVKEIGKAHVVCARTRLKFIGGERARYR